jgi:hypothetical protein
MDYEVGDSGLQTSCSYVLVWIDNSLTEIYIRGKVKRSLKIYS